MFSQPLFARTRPMGRVPVPGQWLLYQAALSRTPRISGREEILNAPLRSLRQECCLEKASTSHLASGPQDKKSDRHPVLCVGYGGVERSTWVGTTRKLSIPPLQGWGAGRGQGSTLHQAAPPSIQISLLAPRMRNPRLR